MARGLSSCGSQAKAISWILPSPITLLGLKWPIMTPLLRHHLHSLLLSLINWSLCVSPYLVSRPCPWVADPTLYWYVFYLDSWTSLQLNYSFEKGQGSAHCCTFHNARLSTGSHWMLNKCVKWLWIRKHSTKAREPEHRAQGLIFTLRLCVVYCLIRLSEQSTWSSFWFH